MMENTRELINRKWWRDLYDFQHRGDESKTDFFKRLGPIGTLRILYFGLLFTTIPISDENIEKRINDLPETLLVGWTIIITVISLVAGITSQI